MKRMDLLIFLTLALSVAFIPFDGNEDFQDETDTDYEDTETNSTDTETSSTDTDTDDMSYQVEDVAWLNAQIREEYLEMMRGNNVNENDTAEEIILYPTPTEIPAVTTYNVDESANDTLPPPPTPQSAIPAAVLLLLLFFIGFAIIIILVIFLSYLTINELDNFSIDLDYLFDDEDDFYDQLLNTKEMGQRHGDRRCL